MTDERKCKHGYGIKQGPCPVCDSPHEELEIRGEPCSECERFIPDGIPGGPIHGEGCSHYDPTVWLR